MFMYNSEYRYSEVILPTKIPYLDKISLLNMTDFIKTKSTLFKTHDNNLIKIFLKIVTIIKQSMIYYLQKKH